MKKIVSLILLSVMMIAISVNVFASDSVLDDEEFTPITGNQYNSMQDNTTNNETNNEAKNNNTTTLPQTGVEDYGVGLLLVICVCSTIFAYKKISDYRNI